MASKTSIRGVGARAPTPTPLICSLYLYMTIKGGYLPGEAESASDETSLRVPKIQGQ